MTVDATQLSDVLADAVIEDPEAGIYRANRRIFTDEEIFELEMTHIFEGNWVYLAHESQVPNAGDYFTTYIGRQPVRSEEHTSELQSRQYLVCRLLLEKKKKKKQTYTLQLSIYSN